ncbi:hypothetical protein CC1G_09891 [Coprinopsis cinerea okayama7|uniref:Uncharacterized protein n=1 Tax=Coprinopsis cinerea (strain Okayama-7 / 130 / ATCC MYA-4618 / FGSC 9003) TaxID=240176 RepID=A8N8N2_COPC7|nr:hypothetical protein CC1G_09891 [Coprinopsis cinerea okayama7\|eukprot:XP_001831188.2 hypothetical protein CC1G_09891 [Coprinopsis cinerea okayama7\
MRTQYSPSDRTLATVAFQATFKVLFWVQLLVWIALCPSSTVAQTSPTHRNVTVPLFSDQIVYTPFLCDAAEMLENPEACAGAWFSTNVPDIPFPVVTSLGQNSSTGDIIPQMFFRFRASTLYLTFVPGFNASVNLTLSATNNAEITTTVQSSIGLATVVNIPEDLITTLALTVLPSSTPVQFGLGPDLYYSESDSPTAFPYLNLLLSNDDVLCDVNDHDARGPKQEDVHRTCGGDHCWCRVGSDVDCWSCVLLVEAEAEKVWDAASLQ